MLKLLRGGILRPMGDFPKNMSRAILAGTILVGRLGTMLAVRKADPIAKSPRGHFQVTQSSLLANSYTRFAKQGQIRICKLIMRRALTNPCEVQVITSLSLSLYIYIYIYYSGRIPLWGTVWLLAPPREDWLRQEK